MVHLPCGAKRKRAAKKPQEPPLAPDMQTKLAEWKQAEKECKCGLCETEHRGRGKWHSSFPLGGGVTVLAEPGAEW